MPSNRTQSRYHVEDYRPTLGHYHTLSRARVEYFWVIIELDVKVHFVNPEVEMVKAWKSTLAMARAALTKLEREGRDHPKPQHLTRGMSRLEREVGMRATAKALRISADSVRALIATGDLRARRTRGGKSRGGNYRVPVDSILEYQAKVDAAATPLPHQQPSRTTAKTGSRSGDNLLRAGELARRSGVSRSSIYRLKGSKAITGIRVTAREERFPESAVEIVRSILVQPT